MGRGLEEIVHERHEKHERFSERLGEEVSRATRAFESWQGLEYGTAFVLFVRFVDKFLVTRRLGLKEDFGTTENTEITDAMRRGLGR